MRAGTGPVSLLELGCAKAAARLATDIADELGQEQPVLVVDDLPGDELAAIERLAEGPVRLVAGPDYPGVPPSSAPEDERRIGVGTVGPGAPWTDLRRLGAESLLVVAAGRTEASWLHTVARQLADLGIAIIGVVVVHPDPRDRSDGTLWDALNTAVRGRLAAALSISESAGDLVHSHAGSNGNGNGSGGAGHVGNGVTQPVPLLVGAISEYRPAIANGSVSSVGDRAADATHVLPVVPPAAQPRRPAQPEHTSRPVPAVPPVR